MTQAVGSFLLQSRGVAFTAMALLVGSILAGCSGGTGSTISTGIRTADDHGDNPFTATVVVPDGANIRGQINFGTDSDLFVFQGIQGVTYTVQILGFPRDPSVRPDLDLTSEPKPDPDEPQDGMFNLTVQILDTDGETQLLNSSGTAGGERYDVTPTGIDAGGDEFVTGDSRVVFVCPTTDDYFIRIQHSRELTGIGDYVIRLATSQNGIAFGFAPPQTGLRDFSSPNELEDTSEDPPILRFNGVAAAVVIPLFIDFREGQGLRFDANFQASDVTFFDDMMVPEDDPQTQAFHIHFGLPNVLNPIASRNFTDGEDPHDIAITLPIDNSTITLTPEDLRLILNFPWYMDVHVTTNFDLLDDPIAVSLPLGDLYSTFESLLPASPGNVITRDGDSLADTERGINPEIDIFYDASLKLFQVARQTYDPLQILVPPLSIIDPYDSSFVGDRVRVHRGGPGEVGPVLIDLGTIPPQAPPPTASFFFPFDTIQEQPGFRNPIRQLTDDEAELLRRAFYSTGVYVEVVDVVTNAPVARAEGFNIGISLLDSNEVDGPPQLPAPTRSNDENRTATYAAPWTEKGTVNFVSRSGAETEVVVNGEPIGSITEQLDGDELPPCDLEGDARTAATEIWPGRYYWHAHAPDGTMWDGYVLVMGGDCQTIILE